MDVVPVVDARTESTVSFARFGFLGRIDGDDFVNQYPLVFLHRKGLEKVGNINRLYLRVAVKGDELEGDGKA